MPFRFSFEAKYQVKGAEQIRDRSKVPERFSKSTSKGAADRDAKGLSWFKPTAKEHIAKAFELKAILEENGYAIEVLKESRIGYVTFEDEFQIVAEPFSDTLR
ncbi:MAG: hypothetical protein ACJAYH_001966 [Celeribacter sp.]|jgi:hypothetical protein